MNADKTANNTRIISFKNLKIGDRNCPPIFCLDIPIFNLEEMFQTTKNFYGTKDRKNIPMIAQECDCDILSLRFNIENTEKICDAAALLKELLPQITKPLMIRGSGNAEIDRILLPELIKNLDRECIISSADENTYKSIIPSVINGGHIIVLKSPIDINLAKELNILSSDLGLDLDKIIIDTDIGGLGYGLEYGYSIMEKIRLEGIKGDNYLNMPMISFAAEETLKTKEAKSDTFSPVWGSLAERAELFEITAASAVMAAGSDIIVLNNPQTISIMKGLE